MNKQEIIQYLQENPGWYLQYSHGIRGNGWWQLRENGTANYIPVDGRSAMAARSLLQPEKKCRYGETNYLLPSKPAEKKKAIHQPDAPTGISASETAAWEAGWKAGWSAATGQKT